jgi:signal transduction histidine kinase
MTHDPKPNPSRRSAKLLGTVLLAPLWAVPFALFFGLLFGATAQYFLLSYKISFVFTLTIRIALWATGRWLVPALRIPDEDSAWLPIAAVYLGVSMSASYVAAILTQAFVAPGFIGHGGRSLIGLGLYALLFSGLFMGIVFARHFYGRAVERASQVERIRAELARAELRALRAQVHPHFLFNTLNSIAALIGENPPAAEDLVTRLGDVFRYSLTSARHDHVPFADELEFVRNCLAIEQARFGDRLRIEEAVEPGLGAIPVPPLLLQPLVENAVRYAVNPRVEGGRVRIEASREGDTLRITVDDDGPGFTPGAAPAGHGVGLESVRERLRFAGGLHALEIDSRPGVGARVTLVLPIPAPERPDSTPEAIR